jgi:transposase
MRTHAHTYARTYTRAHPPSQLQGELDKLRPKPRRTIRDRTRITDIEDRLDGIGR